MVLQSASINEDFRLARAAVEKRDKSMRDKLMRLDEAVRSFVKDGDHVAVGGSLYTRAPIATVFEILRRRPSGLTVSRGLAGFETELLVVAGLVKRVVSSWWSPGYAWGLSMIMREFVQRGQLEFEEWSHGSLALRLRAGAMGVSFLPSMSVQGSDLQRVNRVKEVTCPFTGAKVLLVPALFPDVGIIHAHRADRFGNVQIDGYPFIDQDIARASRRVIVTAEEIVDTEVFRREPEKTVIPYFCVDAVVEVPFGAYPGECWNMYETDFDYITSYVDLIRKNGIDGAKKYIEEAVYGKGSFENFLKSIGEARLTARRRAFRDAIN